MLRDTALGIALALFLIFAYRIAIPTALADMHCHDVGILRTALTAPSDSPCPGDMPKLIVSHDDLELWMTEHVSLEEKKGALTFRFILRSFREDNGLYYFEGCDLLQDKGFPLLPYFYGYFILPENSIIRGVEVDVLDATVEEPEKLVFFEENGYKALSMPSSVLRGLPGRFPGKEVYIYKHPTRWGVDVCQMLICPFQAMENGLLKICKDISIKIDFTFKEETNEEQIEKFVNKALRNFKTLVKDLELARGVRAWEKSEDSKRSLIVIGDEAMHYMAIPLRFYWLDDRVHGFGLICLRPGEERLIPEMMAKLKSMGYGQPIPINSQAELLALIEEEWLRSPTMVVAEDGMAYCAAPLASFLSCPLLVRPSVDDRAIAQLMEELDVKTLIVCGDTDVEVAKPVDVVRLMTEEEVNMFFYATQYHYGFLANRYHEELDWFLSTVLNRDDYDVFKGRTKEPGTWYLVLVPDVGASSPYELEFSTAATMLAAYRSATVVRISPTEYWSELAEISYYLDYYEPYYLALYGDGDLHEIPCFLHVEDPTGEEEFIPTDFYWMERNECRPPPNSAWSPFYPDIYVGRPIAVDDVSSQAYVNLIASYEDGAITEAYYGRSAVFSYSFGDGEASSDIHDMLWDAHATYNPMYTRDAGDFTGSRVLYELYSGLALAYFNTHGNPGVITMGDDTALTGASLWGYDFSAHPPFVYVDACSTARFAGALDNATELEDDTCIATQFMSHGILGYLGSTAKAFLGYFDHLDLCFFELWLFRIYSPRGEHVAGSLGLITAHALARFTASSASDASGLTAEDKKTILEVMLIGDPALKLYFGHLGRPEDDDAEPPTLVSLSWEPEVLTDSHMGDLVISATLQDPSGIEEMHLAYQWRSRPGEEPGAIWRILEWGGGPWEEATPITIEFAIPRDEWIDYVGLYMVFYIYASDCDNDRANDASEGVISDTFFIHVQDDDPMAPICTHTEDSGDVYTNVLGQRATESYELIADWADSSGIYSVEFRYKFGEDGEWSEWEAGELVAIYGEGRGRYRYLIPADIWTSQTGKIIYWEARALDNDTDRPDDRSLGTVRVRGGRIIDWASEFMRNTAPWAGLSGIVGAGIGWAIAIRVLGRRMAMRERMRRAVPPHE